MVPIRRRISCEFILYLLFLSIQTVGNAKDDAEPPDPDSNTAAVNHILPAPTPPPEEQDRVNWTGVMGQSVRFLFLEQGFRYATEEGSRRSHQSFLGGYAKAVTNLHGWSDGDPFYVNYVGHPMQGAVSGYIWTQNDGRYRRAEFGRNREYWRSRLRAAAFAWAYSEQFEIGPLSEASIGATQAYHPQQGFVDHVVTPTLGLSWMLAEDAMDKYVIQWIERRTTNPYYRRLVRGSLNPSRSMANLLAGRLPWHRETRPGVLAFNGETADPFRTEEPESYPELAPFEFTVISKFQKPVGEPDSGPCIGGGASGALRVSASVQAVVEVTGCKITGLNANASGDSLSFLVGPRWTPSPGGSWSPYVQLLAGGNKVAIEEIDRAAMAAIEAAPQNPERVREERARAARQIDSAGFAVSLSTGIDRKLNNALALRIASIEYTRAWMGNVDGLNYSRNLQFTGGLVLRMGTW